MDFRNKELKKINILFIVSILPPYPGGAAVDYRSFLKGLSGREDLCNVSVLTEKGCSKDVDNVAFRDTLFNYDSAGAGAKSRLRQAANYLLILWRIISAKEDIIHIHARYVYAKYAGRVIWLALWLSRAKAVVDIRDRFYDNFGFGHHFIVCSEELLKYYSWVRNASCLPVPVEVRASGRKAPGRHIAYFGSVARNKGILELVDGFKEYVKASKDPLELHIYGHDMIGEQFLKNIEGVDRIRFFGPIPNEEVAERISECRGVVLPSKSEGMPRVCLETMMLGRVLACHRNVRSIFPCIPGEFVLEDLTPSEFNRVLTNIEASGGRASYDYDFSVHAPENVTERLLELYSNVLGYTYTREGACLSQ
ncbi:MAG: glycosyltransferase family 4 protein [Deltaproteobacteria bacterium]|nr:glycosyltransferase family 4 protein [Deltaproteobacteria bacterium]